MTYSNSTVHVWLRNDLTGSRDLVPREQHMLATSVAAPSSSIGPEKNDEWILRMYNLKQIPLFCSVYQDKQMPSF